LYKDKLLKLYDNLGVGLCLLDSVSLFFHNVYNTALDAIDHRPNFIDKKQDRGYDLPHVLQSLLEFLCKLSKKDFDAILYYYFDEDDLPKPSMSSEYKMFPKKIGSDIKLPTMEEGKQEDVTKWMKLFIFQMLNATNIGNREMPLLGEKHTLALSKVYTILIVMIDNRCTGLVCSWDSDSPFFVETEGLSDIMSSQAPTDV
jgi:hypothetical protein